MTFNLSTKFIIYYIRLHFLIIRRLSLYSVELMWHYKKESINCMLMGCSQSCYENNNTRIELLSSSEASFSIYLFSALPLVGAGQSFISF